MATRRLKLVSRAFGEEFQAERALAFRLEVRAYLRLYSVASLYSFSLCTEAPSPSQASALHASAAALAQLESSKGGIYAALRWVQILAMLVVIRFLACRCTTLLDMRVVHVTVADDDDSPLGTATRFFIPKQKGDPLSSNGGAALRAVCDNACARASFFVDAFSLFHSPLCSIHSSSIATCAPFS